MASTVTTATSNNFAPGCLEFLRLQGKVTSIRFGGVGGDDDAMTTSPSLLAVVLSEGGGQ